MGNGIQDRALMVCFGAVFPLLLSAVTATDTDNVLRSWLKHLTFGVPDIPFDKMGVAGTLSNITCSQLVLNDLASAFIEPASLQVSLDGIGANCSADWEAKAIGLKGVGGFVGTVADSSMHISVALSDNGL